MYTSKHHKKVPTGIPNIPPEVLLEKRVNNSISVMPELGRDKDEYTMENDTFGIEDISVGEDEEKWDDLEYMPGMAVLDETDLDTVSVYTSVVCGRGKMIILHMKIPEVTDIFLMQIQQAAN